jgi:hypothetical protein
MRNLRRIIMVVPLVAASAAFAAEPLNDQQLDGLNAGFSSLAEALATGVGAVVATETMASGSLYNVKKGTFTPGGEASLTLVRSTAMATSATLTSSLPRLPIP